MGAQEAVYLALQIPLTKGTREVVYINTCASRERVFLLKPKSVLDELPAEPTNIESDNIYLNAKVSQPFNIRFFFSMVHVRIF